MKNAGIGCGFFVIVAIVLSILTAVLPSANDQLIAACVYAMLLSVPLFFVGHFIPAYGKYKFVVWSGCWILCILLGIVAPIKTSDKEEAKEEKTETVKTEEPQNPQSKPEAAGDSKSSNVATQAQKNAAPQMSLDEVMAELDGLIGLKEVKSEIHKLVASAQIAQARKEQGLKSISMSYHCVFTGNPGTGKTTVARYMGEIYRNLGILKSGHLVETDRSGLVGRYVGETAIKTNQIIDSALDGVLFIDEAYALASGDKSDYGNEAIATLLKRMEDDRDRLVVIVAGYSKEMKAFIDSNSGMKSRFTRYINFPDYTPEELGDMFRMRAKKNQFVLSPTLEAGLNKIMARNTKHKDNQFGNGRFVRNLFEAAVERQATRLANLSDGKPLTKEQLTTLTLEDVDEKLQTLDHEEVTVEQALKELDQLIGMKNVKEEVRKIAEFVQISKEREDAGMKNAQLSYHCVFTGNPGTGKTTVARILAKIYKALGVIDKGHLVETDRSGLVAEYVGQTVVKTNKLIDEALGGVLFIDEAYTLVQGGPNDYGNEAIATLLKRMEDDRDRLIVIVAGYPEEMNKFIDANPGLQSRFTRYLYFPDYTNAELADMFRMYAKRSHYVLSEEFDSHLVAAMQYLTKNRDKNFGNGRFARNLFEKAIERQATRLTTLSERTPEMLKTLELKDIGLFIKSKPNTDNEKQEKGE